MLILSREAIRAVLTVQDALAAARAAFVALSTGSSIVPARAHIATADGITLIMPGYDPGTAMAGVKVVSVREGNAARGLATVPGVVLLVDAITGAPAALLDGTLLTRMRTGAAIGLGAELFAQPDAATVALFGAGATARTSLWSVCAVRPVREVRVVQRHPERFAAFAADMRTLLSDSCPVLRPVAAPAEALAGAEIVITATTTSEPLFPGGLIEPGAYIGALGAYTPRTRELDSEAVRRATVIVDTRAGARAEAGDIAIPIAEGTINAEHIHAEIGEVAAGLRPGRRSPDEIMLFKSVGNAMQDLTLAARALERARQQGLGATVRLD